MPRFDFSGKVAVITGGTSGVGCGIAEGLARAGASVVIAGLPARDRAAHRELFEDIGAPFRLLECDLTTDEAPAEAVALAVSEFGCLDMVVSAAGIFRQA